MHWVLGVINLKDKRFELYDSMGSKDSYCLGILKQSLGDEHKDKKGSELFYVHAEKDKQVIVENDRFEEVGRNEDIKIKNNRTVEVGNNEGIAIEKKRRDGNLKIWLGQFAKSNICLGNETIQ